MLKVLIHIITFADAGHDGFRHLYWPASQSLTASSGRESSMQCKARTCTGVRTRRDILRFPSREQLTSFIDRLLE